MKVYCLKFGKGLWPAYLDTTKSGVKEQVWAHFGEKYESLIKTQPKFSIVRAEIKEIP